MKAACLDSSCWIEFFTGGPNSQHYLPLLRSPETIVVSAVSIYEVWRHTERTAGAAKAHQLTDWMSQGVVIPVDADLARAAATLGLQHRLALADSLIYATALQQGATFWSQDADHRLLPGITYHPKLPA
jgi:toxin FitB